jgi:hypothetical protein
VTGTNVVYIVLGLAIAALVVVRQLRARPVNANFRLPLILGIIGLIELTGYLQKGHMGSAAIAGLAGSLVLAAGFGVVRALTVRLWIHDGQPWRQGTWLAGVLWVVTLAAHLGFDQLADRHAQGGNLASSSILLYVAFTYTVQRVILQERARRIPLGDGGAKPLT